MSTFSVVHRWYGLPTAAEAARAALATDPRVGAIVPAPGVPFRVLDGATALSFSATEAFPLPAGLLNDKPETIAAIQGEL
jgi:hypothetical protein